MILIHVCFSYGGDCFIFVIGTIVLLSLSESLQTYFSQYGEVVDCVVMKNPQTGKSRGFGFVTYSDASCVETVLAVKGHSIDGRQVQNNFKM